jgi:DNA-binding HxlR family transcriptional regulator
MTSRPFKCPAEITLKVIGGRWKVLILFQLFQRVKRFSELQRAVQGITQKVLTEQLREMERDGIVKRTVYAQVPPKVEYELTERGQSLKPVIRAMCAWGLRDSGQIVTTRERGAGSDGSANPSCRDALQRRA